VAADGPRVPRGRGRVKASLQLARAIVQAIYDEGMKPGDRYLSEAEAIRYHQVGRGTYREALRFLELHGVFVMRSGPAGGPEISRPTWRDLASTIALLMQFAAAPLRAILEARVVIEPGMVALAAVHATDDEVEEMARTLAALEADIGVYRVWRPAYDRYWRLLAEASHNPLLASLSPALRTIVNSGGFVPDEPYRVETVGRLRAVHAAVVARDPEAARRAMLELDLAFERRLTEGYPRQMDRVVCWPEVAAADDADGDPDDGA
jgi:GntR family transcriptional regulator, transcriptional repressor for pyruvate dehydrogenase complex